MPKGPQGQKRPADVIGNAVKVMRIATGEEEEALPERSAAAELGSKGGKARASALSKKRRREIAEKAAAKRWGTDLGKLDRGVELLLEILHGPIGHLPVHDQVRAQKFFCLRRAAIQTETLPNRPRACRLNFQLPPYP